MRTEADTVLEQARQEILNAAGQGILLNEFTGSQGYDVDLKFTPWDMDSDYDDVNVCATVETLLKEKMPEKGQDVKVSVVKVESWPASGNGEEAVEDYSVIAQDGAINYEKVTYDMLDSEVGGAVYDVTLKLTYLQSSLEEEATFIVPMHTYTRQERLDDAAEYAVRFSTIQGNNSAPEQITGDLTLPNLADDDTYAYYAIFSAWESSQPEVVAVDGKVNHGDQDVPVTLKVKTYYSQAWLDDSDYMMDPGPLGENESVDEIQVTVLSADNALQTTVQKAQTLYNQAKEGTGYGQYAPGAKAKLNHAIKEAKAVLADDNADNAAKQAAMAKLELAIASFEDERRPVAANVSIVIHADNGFLYPRTEIVAPSDADAGYPVADVDGVTAFDALAYVHQQVYGEAFAADPQAYLNITKDGFVTALMARQTSNIGFFVNHKYPADAYGTGYTMDQTVLKDGDLVEVFIYGDEDWLDEYLFFDKDALKVNKGKDFTLTLQGFPAMFAYDAAQSVPQAIANAKVLVGSSWDTLEDTGKVTDENGKVTLNLPEKGVYYVSVNADRAGIDTSHYIAPACIVTVGSSSSGSHQGGSSSNDNNKEPDPVTPSEPAAPGTSTAFTDVPAGHWAADAIGYMAEKGYINGRTDAQFVPNGAISRAEFVAILARMSGDTLPQAEAKFADVAADSWYAPYVAWGVAHEIVTGRDQNTFDPNGNISREEMAVMIQRYSDYQEISLPAATTADFADFSQCAAYAKEAVARVAAAEIINGRENNQFMPKANASRAEAATMLYRLLVK